jgi:hypothetical protein
MAPIAAAYARLPTVPDRFKQLGSSLNTAARFRDGFLLVVAVAYALGYATWSIHAYREHLGLLPALRFQYILAGLTPLILIWVLISIVMPVRGIKSGGWAIVATFVVVVTTISVSILALPFLGIGGLAIYAVATLLLFSTGIVFGAVGFLPIAVPWAGLSVIAAGLAFYVAVLYPQIPQELGGVRPSCAYFDLKAKEVGEPSLRELTATRELLTDSVVRTEKVSVLFVGNDFYLIRPKDHAKEEAVYRINRDAVAVVTGCD